MYRRINTDSSQRTQVKFLDIFRRGFHYNLVLVVVLQTIRVFSITAISGASAGLNIGGFPGLRTDGTKKCSRVERAGTNLHIEWLYQNATLFGPISLQAVDEILESHENPVIEYTIN
jgi:hypothetical protein